MSSQVFPTLIGLEWNVPRAPMWSTIVNDAISGKQTAMGLWSYPKWAWELSFSYLPSKPSQTDLQTLAGFFNKLQGRFDTFLYADADDNAVTAQAIGTGDGVMKTFQLVRSFGGFVEPIFAPNVVAHVYSAGVDAGGWTVSNWGATAPGIVTFSSAPANGAAITADFSFYFPCRMDDDTISFTNFMKQMWSGKSVKFTSVK